MAMKKCKECGHEVAKSAEKCPSCGATLKHKTNILTIIVGGVVLLILVGVLGGRSKKPSGSGSGSRPRSRPTRVVAKPKVHPEQKKVKVGDTVYIVHRSWWAASTPPAPPS